MPQLFPGFMEPLLQKCVMGSDWLAGPVCCYWLNRLSCTSKHPASQLSGMRSCCIVNNGVINIAYQFELD